MKGSFRLKLTLWNVGLLALILLGFSAFLLWMTRQTVSTTADQQLIERTRRLISEVKGENPGGPRGQGNGFGLGTGGPRGNSPFQGGIFGQQRQNNPGSPPQLNPNDDLSAEFRQNYELRRPRIYDQNLINVDQSDQTKPVDPRALKYATQKIKLTTTRVSNTTVRVATAQTKDPEGRTRVIQLADGMGVVDQVIAAQTALLIPIVPLTLVLAAAGGLFLAGRALNPIQTLTKAAEEIDETNLDKKLPVEGNDELARLSQKLNEMVVRLDTAFQKQNHLLEQQRQFTADASHELRTPLTRIKLATSSALDPTSDLSEKIHALTVVDQASDSMAHLVDQMLILARTHAKTPLQAPLMDLEPPIMAAIDLAGLTTDPRLILNLKPAQAHITTDAITRILTNLLTNAARYTPPKGSITVTLHSHQNHTVIEVKDTGEGIPPHHLDKITERFYRVDSSRNLSSGGTGLGLAIVKSLVEQANGTLTIQSQQDIGTTATVTLPNQNHP